MGGIDKIIARRMGRKSAGVGRGLSVRHTALKADAADLVRISDVVLLQRMRSSKNWLHWILQALNRGKIKNAKGGGVYSAVAFTALSDRKRRWKRI